MGATELAKEAARIASTTGLSKDVIDLLEKKLTLLTSETKSLEKENLSLREKVTDQEKQIDDFKARLHKYESSEFPSPEQKDILTLLAQAGRYVPISYICQSIGTNKTKAEYYVNGLENRNWITGSHFYTGQESEYKIIDLGTEYLIKHDMI